MSCSSIILLLGHAKPRIVHLSSTYDFVFGTPTEGLPRLGLYRGLSTVPHLAWHLTFLVPPLLSLMKVSPQQHPVLCIEGKSLFSHFLKGQCGLNTVSLLSAFPHFGFLFPGSGPPSCLLTLPSFGDWSLALTPWYHSLGLTCFRRGYRSDPGPALAS